VEKIGNVQSRAIIAYENCRDILLSSQLTHVDFENMSIAMVKDLFVLAKLGTMVLNLESPGPLTKDYLAHSGWFPDDLNDGTNWLIYRRDNMTLELTDEGEHGCEGTLLVPSVDDYEQDEPSWTVWDRRSLIGAMRLAELYEDRRNIDAKSKE
jgi:hypothetical protein